MEEVLLTVHHDNIPSQKVARFIIQWEDGTSRPLDVHIAKQIEVVV